MLKTPFFKGGPEAAGEPVDGLPPTTRRHRIGSLTVIVGHEETEYGMRWHLSISHPMRYPRWRRDQAAAA